MKRCTVAKRVPAVQWKTGILCRDYMFYACLAAGKKAKGEKRTHSCNSHQDVLQPGGHDCGSHVPHVDQQSLLVVH